MRVCAAARGRVKNLERCAFVQQHLKHEGKRTRRRIGVLAE